MTSPLASKRLGAVAMGYLLDRLVGEPPAATHPVRAYGSLMAALERRLYSPRRVNGAIYTTAGIAAAALAGAAVPAVALAAFVTTAGRALEQAALVVATDLDRGELGSARDHVRALVGRDPTALDEAELARAVVESVAENTNDGVIAPLFYALIAGAPGAYCYRAANTLDSLVGYHNSRYSRFGWASARLDDFASFVPARLTAMLVVVVRPWRRREVLRAVRNDAPKHPSPNAGVAEAAFAAALGLQLGGLNTYSGQQEERAPLGTGRRPERADIDRAVRLSRHVGAAGAGALLAARVALALREQACNGRSPSGRGPTASSKGLPARGSKKLPPSPATRGHL